MSAVALAVPQQTFSERLLDLLEMADYHRADTEEEHEAIFRLRYDAYLGEGAIRPNFERRFTDAYDELGNTWVFGVYLENRLVSSIRISVATGEFPDMPALSAFPKEVEPELAAGKIIIDPTRHAVDREAMRRYPQLVFLTLRLAWMAGEYFQADNIFAAVRAEHQAFYRRTFGHRVVCEPRPYLMLDKPLGLMTLDFPEARERVYRRYPFFRSSVFERRMLFERLQQPAEAPRRRPPLRLIEPTGESVAHAG